MNFVEPTYILVQLDAPTSGHYCTDPAKQILHLFLTLVDSRWSGGQFSVGPFCYCANLHDV